MGGVVIVVYVLIVKHVIKVNSLEIILLLNRIVGIGVYCFKNTININT